jgi:hypothetical protein
MYLTVDKQSWLWQFVGFQKKVLLRFEILGEKSGRRRTARRQLKLALRPLIKTGVRSPDKAELKKPVWRGEFIPRSRFWKHVILN